MLILSIIILVLVIIMLVFLFLKDILSLINNQCFYLREFISKNGGIFTVVFILAFFIEQILLIIAVSYFLEIPLHAQFVISLFALLVLTTATLEKFILEKRYEYQKQEVVKTASQNEEILKELKQFSDDYHILYKKYINLKKQR